MSKWMTVLSGRNKMEKSTLEKNFCNKNICYEIDFRSGNSWVVIFAEAFANPICLALVLA